jgi:hypothetical protein
LPLLLSWVVRSESLLCLFLCLPERSSRTGIFGVTAIGHTAGCLFAWFQGAGYTLPVIQSVVMGGVASTSVAAGAGVGTVVGAHPQGVKTLAARVKNGVVAGAGLAVTGAGHGLTLAARGAVSGAGLAATGAGYAAKGAAYGAGLATRGVLSAVSRL